MSDHFADRLMDLVEQKNSRLIVGLDPDIERFPKDLLKNFGLIPDEDGKLALNDDNFASAGQAVADFNTNIIRAVAPFVVAIKPQMAYYERLGPDGLKALQQTILRAKEYDLMVILDAKRGDIASTSRAYARGYFGSEQQPAPLPVDAVTLNPYMGEEVITPFLEMSEQGNKGIFILVRTSNPSAKLIQDIGLSEGGVFYEKVARLVSEWGEGLVGGERGYSSVGAVVGATEPQAVSKVRELIPQGILLLPGFGAQGAGGAEVVEAFDPGGKGAIVNSSRGIIYAYEKTGGDIGEAAAKAAENARDEINEALRGAGKLRESDF